MREVVIVEAVRTPIGRRNGKLKDLHPVVLGSLVLKEIVKRAGIKPESVDEVVALPNIPDMIARFALKR